MAASPRAARRSACILALLSATVLLAAHPTSAAPPAGAALAAAREALWTNRLAAADSLFAAAVTADPRDAEAWRGLILAQLARGRDDEVVASLKAYTKLLPASPYDEFLPEFVDENSGLGSRSFYETLLRYMKKLGEADALAPVDRRRMLGQAIRYATLAGRHEDAAELAAALHRVEVWGVLGPFDNTSGCGHGKQHFDSWDVNAETVRGQHGQPVRWFQPAYVGLDRFIAPGRYFPRTGYTTAYLRTSVIVPRAGTYLISVGYAGDLTFWLNRNVVHAGPRSLGGDEVLHWEVDLPAGPSRLAFKVSSRDEEARLACGISRPDGSAVSGLEFLPFRNAMPDSGACPPPRRVASPLLAKVAARCAEVPADREAAFWELWRAARFEEPAAVGELASRLSALHGSSALLMYGVSLARERAADVDAAAQTLRASADLDSNLVQARLELAVKDLAHKRPGLALRAADAVLRGPGWCRRALQIRLQALTDRQEMEAVREFGERLAAPLRDDPLPYRALLTYAESRGQERDARRHRDEYLKRLPPGYRELTTVWRSFQRQDAAAARGALEDVLRFLPDRPEVWHMYVRSLLAGERIEEAKDAIRTALASFPQNPDLLELQAGFVEAGAYQPDIAARSQAEFDALRKQAEQRRRGEAADLLQHALAADPANFDIRDRLRTLRGLPSYRTFLPDPKPDALVARRVAAADWPGEDAVVLLEQRRCFIFDDQAALRDRVLAVQLLTAAGVAQWETYDFAPGRDANDVVVLLARTVKPDGAVKEARRSPLGAVFADAAPGDILLLHYQVTSAATGALRGQVWDQHLFAFPLNPCRESSFTLVRPAARTVRTQLWHSDAATGGPVAARSLDGGLVEETWRFSDLPRLQAEPLAASPLTYSPWLDVSTIPTWGMVAAWYADLAEGQAEVTPEVRRKAEELTRGAGDDEDRLGRLLRFVGNEITYQSLPFFQSAYIPRQAAEVLRDRFGDCKDKSCLLIALARAAGIDSCRFALTTPGAPADAAFLPSPRFNHVVVQRRLADGSSRWYDPTVRHALPGTIPQQLAGVPALPAVPARGQLVTIDRRGSGVSPVATRSQLALDARGDGRLSRRVAWRGGDRLSALRDRFESLSDDAVRDELAQALAVDFPGATILTAAATGRGDADSCLVLTCEARLPAVAEADAGIISLRLPWSTGLDDMFGAVVGKAERRSPIDLRAMNVAEVDEVSLELPPGTPAPALPNGVSLAWGECRYATTFRPSPGGFTARRELVISGLAVGRPVYAGFKEFLEGVRRDMRRTCHLRTR